MGLALVGYLVIRGTVMFNGYLYADDFALRFWAHESGLTPEYLFRSYYGHVQPWGLLAQWILQAGWPGSWTALMVWAVGMQLAILDRALADRAATDRIERCRVPGVPGARIHLVHVRGRRVVVHDHRKCPVRAVHDGVHLGAGAGSGGPAGAVVAVVRTGLRRCRARHQPRDDVPARAGSDRGLSADRCAPSARTARGVEPEPPVLGAAGCVHGRLRAVPARFRPHLPRPQLGLRAGAAVQPRPVPAQHRQRLGRRTLDLVQRAG